MLGVQAAAPDKFYHAAKMFIVAAMVFTDLRHAVACAFSGAAPIAAAGGPIHMYIYKCSAGPWSTASHVFVHAPVHGAAPMATAEGMFSMPGVQQLMTSLEDVANAHRGRGGLHRPWATHSRVRLLAVRIPSPPPEAWPPCWARRRL